MVQTTTRIFCSFTYIVLNMKRLFCLLIIGVSSTCLGQQSMNMDSLFNWQDPNLPASSAHQNTYNEVWGYAKDGAEFAFIASTMGTHIFDVTNPSMSEQIAFVEGALAGPDVIHRDYHDYDDYLYAVCDEGQSTLQIIDLRQLPDTAIVVYDDDTLFARSHNIFIDSSSARMYVCGGSVQFAVYSLANPEQPTLLLDCPAEVSFWSSIGYVHDVYVRGDTAYIHAGWNGFFVVDFRDIQNPQMIASLDVYPQQGYNHSGWLMPDQPYYAMADETHGKDVKILDMSNLSDLVVTDTIGSHIDPFSIPHNLIYHGNYLFISYYFDGLYMFDCSDPAHPVLEGFYDTSTEQAAGGVYRGCWGVYPFLPSGNILASDMQTGLWIFDTNEPLGIHTQESQTTLLNVFPNPANDRLSFDRKFVGSFYQIIDISGRVVHSGIAKSNTLAICNLKTGLYTLLIVAENKSLSSKFVKE